jgi:hypothetical protein
MNPRGRENMLVKETAESNVITNWKLIFHLEQNNFMISEIA